MSYTPLVSPIFTGNPRVPTAAANDNDTTAASTAFVTGAIATAGSGYVTLAGSQTITGAKTLDGITTFTAEAILNGAGGGFLTVEGTGAYWQNSSSISLQSSSFMTVGGSSSGLRWLDVQVSGDADSRFEMDNTGEMTWGNGTNPVDVQLSRTAANVLSLGSGDTLRVPQAPVVATDVANKEYVDSVASGIDWKGSVRVATAAALPAYSRTGNVITASANGALAAVDGVTLVLNDRILLKDGAAGADNGLYSVTQVGTAGTPYILTRTADADNSPVGEVTAGLAVFVAEGTANADTAWVLTTNDPITLNTTALAFAQFSSSATTLNALSDVDTTGAADGSLLRYEATGSQWNDTSTLLFTDAGQLQVTTTGASAGILLGGDANLYRAAADALATDAEFRAVGENIFAQFGAAQAVTIGNVGPSGESAILLGSSGDTSLFRGGANLLRTNDDFQVGTAAIIAGTTGQLTITTAGSTGGIVLGNDTNLYRSAANVLKTDDSLDVAGKLIAAAGQRVAVSTVKTGAYSVDLAIDYIIRTDTSGGALTVTLPASHTAGDIVVIKDVTGSAETNNVTVDPSDADTIDGASTFVLTVNYQAATFVSNGTNWLVV